MPAWLHGVSRRQHALFLVILSPSPPFLSLFLAHGEFFVDGKLGRNVYYVWRFVSLELRGHLSRVQPAALLDDRAGGVKLGAAKIWKHY